MIVRELIARWGVQVDEKSLKKTEEAIKKLKKSAKIAITAVGGMGAAATKMAMDFESGLARAAVLLGDAGASAQQLQKEVFELSRTFGRGPRAIMEAYLTAITTGFATASERVAVLRAALTLARGAQEDLGQMTRAVTATLHTFGMTAEEAGRVADVLIEGAKSGHTTVAELSHRIGYIGTAAKAAGVRFEELVAAMGALTTQGMEARRITSSLSQVINAVIKPTATAKKAAEKYGVDMRAATLASMGFGRWLAYVIDQTHGSASALAELFGSVEAVNTVLSLGRNHLDLFNATLVSMTTRSGHAADAAKILGDTAIERFRALKAELEILAIEFGERLLPVFRDILQRLTRFIDQVGGAEKAVDGLVTAFKVFMGLGIIGFIGKTISAITTLGIAVKGAGGIVAGFASRLAPLLGIGGAAGAGAAGAAGAAGGVAALGPIALLAAEGAGIAWMVKNREWLQDEAVKLYTRVQHGLAKTFGFESLAEKTGGLRRLTREEAEAFLGHPIEWTARATRSELTPGAKNVNARVEVAPMNVHIEATRMTEAEEIRDAVDSALEKARKDMIAQIEAELATL